MNNKYFFFGLFKIDKYSIIFFCIFIIIQIFNVFNSSSNTETDFIEATYEIQNQIGKIQTVLGVIILIFIFNIKLDDKYKNTIHKLYILILFLLCLSLIKYNTKNKSRNVRNIRIFTQKLYNQGLILFMLVLYLFFLGIPKTL